MKIWIAVDEDGTTELFDREPTVHYYTWGHNGEQLYFDLVDGGSAFRETLCLKGERFVRRFLDLNDWPKRQECLSYDTETGEAFIYEHHE